jgi:hypothetical protein
MSTAMHRTETGGPQLTARVALPAVSSEFRAMQAVKTPPPYTNALMHQGLIIRPAIYIYQLALFIHKVRYFPILTSVNQISEIMQLYFSLPLSSPLPPPKKKI